MIRYKSPLLSAGLIFLFLLSCKERNENYPPAPWANYFFEKPGIDPRPISAILEVNDHDIWFGSQNNKGLLHYDGYSWKEYNYSNTSVPFDSVSAIVQDGNGLLWVSWRNGLANFDGTTWKQLDQFTGKRVTSLAVQGIGIIWAGIDGDQFSGGVARYENAKWVFFTTESSGLPSNQILALDLDKDQNLLLGSRNNGIIRYDGISWISLYLGSLGVDPGSINCITTDVEGTTWAGTSESYLLKITNVGAIPLLTGSSKPITRLLTSLDGKIWIGTAGAGLLTYLNGTWESMTSMNTRLPSDSVISLSFNHDGKILSGFSDGHIIYFK